MVAALIHLRAERMHRGAFAGVEHAHLNQRIIRGKPHLAAHGVDFPHEMALSRAADGRITGHEPHRVEI
ncbi:hypothetical protein SDC9_120030 [bioreactor metagenome]|uniref:Uncharacterized protein n=1 Tax=bioreactor metagenome TaxID=1076179 RepID=A0A645C9L9_9ZZZZ